ncbi:MAG: response regulator transcription factor [Candidatus Dormibacteria bacterium]
MTGSPSGRGRHPYGEALSPREEEVIQLAERGHTNREIAQLLSLSERTVESHIRRALQKQGTAGRLRRGRGQRLRGE